MCVKRTSARERLCLRLVCLFFCIINLFTFIENLFVSLCEPQPECTCECVHTTRTIRSVTQSGNKFASYTHNAQIQIIYSFTRLAVAELQPVIQLAQCQRHIQLNVLICSVCLCSERLYPFNTFIIKLHLI